MIIADQAGQPFKPGPYSVSEDASLGGIEVKGGKGIQLDVSRLTPNQAPITTVHIIGTGTSNSNSNYVP